MSRFEQFSDLVREHGGTSHAFSQGSVITANWRVLNGAYTRRGLCGGVCAMYLAFIKDHKGFHEFSKEARAGAGLVKYAERAQEFISVGLMDEAFKALNLERASARILCRNAKAVVRNALGSKSHLALIGLPTHWCATGYEDGKGYEFFDPNLGVAAFVNTLRFALFIEQFLGLDLYEKGLMDVTWVR